MRLPRLARSPLSSSLLGLAACLGAAQAQELVKDINQVSLPLLEQSSTPQDFVELGSRLYFTAAAPGTGRELYFLDSATSAPQLLIDLEAGPDDSLAHGLTELASGNFVFSALGGLYVSDGTAAGTVLLAPGIAISSLTAHQGIAFFMGREDGDFSPNLWRTDGTAAGTFVVETIGIASTYSPANLVVVSTGSSLFYTTLQSAPGGGVGSLFVTDGSVGGATLLVTVQETSAFAQRNLTAVGNRVVWTASAVGSGAELWVSDGTVVGTEEVSLIPGASGSGPSDFTLVGGEAYFRADHPTLGMEIYRTDGTPGGTLVVTDTQGFSPSNLSDVGGQLFFSADSPLGRELWTTTGAFDTEFLFADFAPGPEGSNPSEVIQLGSGVLCRAQTSASGQELFYSEGTAATTYLVSDILSGPVSSEPSGLTAFGGRAFFSALNVFVFDTFAGNDELWSTDGTDLGTQLFADLAPAFGLSSLPQDFVSLGDRVLFSATEGFSGGLLWSSDGTSFGTVPVSDPAQPLPLIEATDLFAFEDEALFAGTEPATGSELWRTDGSAAGTQLVTDLLAGPAGSEPEPLLVWNGELYFSALGAGIGRELFATDGTSAGTRLVRDINPGPSGSGPAVLTPHEGLLYFFATQDSTGKELWRTDGSPSGTSRVADLLAGPQDGVNGVDMASFNGLLYFAGRNSPVGFDYDLWRTDGTASGTGLFLDVGPQSGGYPRVLEQLNGRLTFRANTNGLGQYLSTDGVVVEQLTFPPLDAFVLPRLISNGTQAVGVLRRSGAGLELFATDGTAAGTSVIQQLTTEDPFIDSFQGAQVTTGGDLLFEFGTNQSGHNLWVTDGTSAGTSVLAPVVPLSLIGSPGESADGPFQLQRLGNELLYTATTFAGGWELYKLPLGPLGDWVAEPFGQGCAGSNGLVPTLGTSGAAAIGQTLTLEVDGAAPNSIASTFFSPTFSLSSVGTCSSYLANALFLANLGTDAGGSGSLSFALGNDPALAGLRVWLQALLPDAGGELLGIASLTPALEVIVGN